MRPPTAMKILDPQSPSAPARRLSSTRGALLIVAMLISAVIAISLASFLRLATQSSQLSYRSFYAGASMNAAETGLEQAMWAINKRLEGDTTVGSTNGWTVLSTGAVRRTFRALSRRLRPLAASVASWGTMAKLKRSVSAA